MKITRWDIILIIAVIIISAIFYLLVSTKDKGNYAYIYVDGELYSTMELSSNSKELVEIDSITKNIVSVEDGYVKMEYSDCRDKICVKQAKINKTGESIVCLPNKLSIKIESENTNFFDGVTR